jgi:hypothetical protein
MSLQEELLAQAQGPIEEMAGKVKDRIVEQFGEWVEAQDREKFEARVKEAASYRVKALMSKEREEAEKWAKASATAVASIETLALRAEVIADAKAASLLMETINMVLDTLQGIAGGLLKTVVTGAVSGAITGLTGGAGGPLLGGIAEAAGTFLGDAVSGGD